VPLPPPPITRRATLVLASLGLVAGCEWGPPEDGTDPSADPAPPAPDEDAELASTALVATSGVAALVAATASRHRGLATPLADLTALHLAHLRLLGAAAPEAPQPTPPEVPARSRAALALVVREERRLEDELAALAGRVASGAFARALASMSAAVAQHLAVLPPTGGRG